MSHEKRLLAMLEKRNRWALDAVLEAPRARRGVDVRGNAPGPGRAQYSDDGWTAFDVEERGAARRGAGPLRE